jgi:hypothetical protein
VEITSKAPSGPEVRDCRQISTMQTHGNASCDAQVPESSQESNCSFTVLMYESSKEDEAIGPGSRQDCEASRLIRLLDNPLTDGPEIVSFTLSLREIPGTHFCQRLSRIQGHLAVGRISR